MRTKKEKKYHREYMREWCKKNREKCHKASKKWRDKNPNYQTIYFENNPWAKTFVNISIRCNSEKHHYHKKGIKNFLITKDLRYLWFRDKAYLLKHPSIDRINSDKNYTLGNCRYIELENNKMRTRKDRWAREYLSCIKCKTTKIEHKAFGLCRKCYRHKNHIFYKEVK